MRSNIDSLLQRIMQIPTHARKSVYDFLVKKKRPWTADDIFAMGTWLFVGNGLFLLIGTTSFVSVALVFAKSLQIQESLFSKLAQHLTDTTGFKVSFDAPIEPNWKKGLITISDVSLQSHPSPNDQMTVYDLKVAKLELEVSLMHFLEGKGWIKSLKAKGIRGTIDKTNVPTSVETFKHVSQPGDFQMKDITIKDALVTVLYPRFRPFNISIISGEFENLRKQWLLLDLLSGTNVIGMFDGCLFSLHTPQLTTEDRKTLDLPNMRHFKIDGLSIDQINSKTSGPLSWISRGRVDFNVLIQLPIKEKRSLNFDLFKESLFLSLIKQIETKDQENVIEQSEKPFASYLKIMKHKLIIPILHAINNTISSSDDPENASISLKQSSLEKGRRLMARKFASAPQDSVSFKVDLRLGDLHATVPLNNNSLSYLNSALIRPLVGYINDHKPFIPVSVFFKLDLKEFDGSFTLHDAGFNQELSKRAAESIVQLMNDEKLRMKRFSRVGLWTIQSLIKNLAYAFEPYHNDFAPINF